MSERVLCSRVAAVCVRITSCGIASRAPRGPSGRRAHSPSSAHDETHSWRRAVLQREARGPQSARRPVLAVACLRARVPCGVETDCPPARPAGREASADPLVVLGALDGSAHARLRSAPAESCRTPISTRAYFEICVGLLHILYCALIQEN